MTTLICDLDGVVYLGEQEIPGAGDALRRLADGGWRILFCTNNATRTPADTAIKIDRVTGYPASAGDVATSAQAAASLLTGDEAVYVLGGQGLVWAVEEAGCEVMEDWRSAEVVVVGLDPQLTYERLSGAVLAVGSGARFIASNHDPTLPTPEGLRPGAGAIVAAVAHATGVQPVVAGKPHLPMRRVLAAMASGEIWIVGDRDDTDLAMGRSEGWSTALVTTGVASAPTEAPTLEAYDLAAVVDHLLA
jgi:glycerol-1-phosphatase